jgi:DUF4097 and DUF4098 domain-containing protein YvlB
MSRLSRGAALTLFAAAFVPLAACSVQVGDLTARATDEWTRTYPLTEGGEVEIVNANGRIDIEAVDGRSVEVRAERIARATSDESARDILSRIRITEDIKPGRVSLRTERLEGILIGVRFEVNYKVRAPMGAVVRARATNGNVAVTGFRARVIANSTNGNVTAADVSGGLEARTTNGSLSVSLLSLGEDPIDLRTTNGSVVLGMPSNAKANVSANCVNGVIDVAGLELELMGEQSRRRTRGRLNGGGTPVEINTVNGRIKIAAR